MQVGMNVSNWSDENEFKMNEVNFKADKIPSDSTPQNPVVSQRECAKTLADKRAITTHPSRLLTTRPGVDLRQALTNGLTYQ